MNAQQASQLSFEPGAIVGGKYRVVSLIGIGGVGRVYLARHIELDTEVAIKVLRPEMGDRADAVQRFSREARASVRLRSERIARVLDVGSHEGKPYFVMEYMAGCNLLELSQQGSVDIATLCEFFIQACEGLADAHAQGVVHRDIKPENLFIVRDPSGWRSLKVFDFGISKFSLTGKYSDVDLASMRTEAMMGTPHYISPEQIRSSRDVDHRTDIWSLGAVMFEVLSGGKLPFREEREVTALIAEVLERPHRSLLDIAPNVPERLVAIVDRCLAKDRDLRYQTAAEVALELMPLAPARARASAERAVSVMQAAGMMPLNGDMESLRPVNVTLAERPSLSNPPPISGPVMDDVTALPLSGQRPSESARELAAQSASPAAVLPSVRPVPVGSTRPPMPARGPSMQSSSATAESERASAAAAGWSAPPAVASAPPPAVASRSPGVATLPPVVATLPPPPWTASPPVASAPPPAVASALPPAVASTPPPAVASTPPMVASAFAVIPSEQLAVPVAELFEPSVDATRKRKVVWLLLLLGACLLVGMLLWVLRGSSPQAAAASPAPRSSAAPKAPEVPVTPPAAPVPIEAQSAPAPDASSDRKQAPRKPVWMTRPMVAPVPIAPKASVKSPDSSAPSSAAPSPSPSPPLSPPSPKLELRRER